MEKAKKIGVLFEYSHNFVNKCYNKVILVKID